MEKEETYQRALKEWAEWLGSFELKGLYQYKFYSRRKERGEMRHKLAEKYKISLEEMCIIETIYYAKQGAFPKTYCPTFHWIFEEVFAAELLGLCPEDIEKGSSISGERKLIELPLEKYKKIPGVKEQLKKAVIEKLPEIYASIYAPVIKEEIRRKKKQISCHHKKPQESWAHFAEVLWKEYQIKSRSPGFEEIQKMKKEEKYCKILYEIGMAIEEKAVLKPFEFAGKYGIEIEEIALLEMIARAEKESIAGKVMLGPLRFVVLLFPPFQETELEREDGGLPVREYRGLKKEAIEEKLMKVYGALYKLELAERLK